MQSTVLRHGPRSSIRDKLQVGSGWQDVSFGGVSGARSASTDKYFGLLGILMCFGTGSISQVGDLGAAIWYANNHESVNLSDY